ncbi:phage tail fiber protein [Rhizobium sp. HT1-10]|uniref:phage tail fiber protein n=1 Tax=Rhizobium sp. HT1-10 TaxID=3111638 RepID=UPI003C15FC37
MASITSANAIITLTIPGLFNTPVQLQGFSADNIYESEVQEIAETSMGVDGKLSAGYVFNPINQTFMAIIPPDKPRQGRATLISPETGMVGYPAFNQNNVLVAAIFNPSLLYGGEIEVKSDLTPACGKWKVIRLEYELESLVPKGKWFMKIEAVQIGATTP